jgi:Zn-dependent protease with chaperone function
MSAFKSGDFVHPLDRMARQQLEGIPLLESAVRNYLRMFGEKQRRAWLLGNSIRLGPRQVPDIYRYLPPICQVFGIDEPELYLTRGESNAFTLGHSKAMIVLYDQLLEDLNEDEIEAVLAHECGHILCEHLLYRQMTLALLGGANALGTIVSGPLRAAMLNWFRKSELSADRAAAIYLGSPDPLQRALFHMTGVPKWFTGEISYPEFIAQTREFDDAAGKGKLDAFLTRRVDSTSTHPNPAIRFRELADWSTTQEYGRLLAVRNQMPCTARHQCSSCGHQMAPEWAFCQRCGSPAAADQPTSGPD